ncbi:MAG TPA: SprT family zinc-dependent metalloprotease [Verrucomicrobiae bacterium]|jgi:predicted metal-dependent hydrolase|nr:SprT family zinc-dependent metalloprotease [Verrucomicrobiae bacterium]
MPSKQFALDDQIVTIYKRKSNRSLRLSVTADGRVRVSIPTWAPYSAGLKFARSREQWIRAQRPEPLQLKNGQAVGKAHHLRFAPSSVPAAKVTSRVYPTEIVVSYPAAMPTSDAAVQQVAEAAGIRALRRQAEHLLPQRLAGLAAAHNFSYGEVRIKHLKSRWGSCDHNGTIVLNLFLMQLPWDCIDYVLLHELTHTRVLRHGPPFWEAMQSVLPDMARLRKAIRAYQPAL